MSYPDISLATSHTTVVASSDGSWAVDWEGDGVVDVVVDATTAASLTAYVAQIGTSTPSIDPPNFLQSLSAIDLEELNRFFGALIQDRTDHAASSDAFMNQLMNSHAVLLLLAYLAGQSKDEVVKSIGSLAKVDSQTATALSDKIAEKIIQAAEDRKAAEKSGLLGKIFGWIATAIAIVSAVVTMQPALITAAIIMLTMQIDQETGGHILKGISGGNAKAAEILNWVAIGLTVVLSLGASATALSTRLAGVAAKMAQSTSKLSRFIAWVFKPMEMSPAANKMFALLQVAEGVSTISKTAADYSKAQHEHDYADNQEENQRLQARLELALQSVETSNALIKEIIAKLEGNITNIADAIQKESDAIDQTIQVGV